MRAARLGSETAPAADNVKPNPTNTAAKFGERKCILAEPIDSSGPLFLSRRIIAASHIQAADATTTAKVVEISKGRTGSDLRKYRVRFLIGGLDVATSRKLSGNFPNNAFVANSDRQKDVGKPMGYGAPVLQTYVHVKTTRHFGKQ